MSQSTLKHQSGKPNERSSSQMHLRLSSSSPNNKRGSWSAIEKGASAWVTTLPIDDHGFFLHNGDFRDALCLCYGWPVAGLPHKCCCGSVFSIDHTRTCHKGGYPSIRHNEIQDVSSNFLSEVVPTFVLNQSFSLLVENPFNPGVPTHRMKPSVTCLWFLVKRTGLILPCEGLPPKSVLLSQHRPSLPVQAAQKCTEVRAWRKSM